MVLLENEAFLSELTRLFQRTRNKGSVTITMKRYDGRTKPIPKKKKEGKGGKKGKTPMTLSPESPAEYMCLFRAKHNSQKISTVVHAKDVNKFQLAYCNVLKGNMDALKKLKKSKATAKAT
ncbi:unnamed protein product [Darwinula stevensoni]|uniref:Signal recognition particle 14 kDa protein n=1 Tax=Darwinula stevensoni TaxID=69355 RepID=A0A7R8X5B3_9CRUS|nr:unnamed protein product [Darwinula stevensoni]CAG0878542.1 unnamed protein product [Darwinula stevensoni]